MPDFDPLNGRYGEIRGVAKSVLPQLQTNAAAATWPNVNVGKVRDLILGIANDEGLVWGRNA